MKKKRFNWKGKAESENHSLTLPEYGTKLQGTRKIWKHRCECQIPKAFFVLLLYAAVYSTFSLTQQLRNEISAICQNCAKFSKDTKKQNILSCSPRNCKVVGREVTTGQNHKPGEFWCKWCSGLLYRSMFVYVFAQHMC